MRSHLETEPPWYIQYIHAMNKSYDGEIKRDALVAAIPKFRYAIELKSRLLGSYARALFGQNQVGTDPERRER